MGSIPAFLAERIAQPIYHHCVRCTSHFWVKDSCIGCGLCSKKCPIHAIEMQHQKPVWVKDKCVMCFGCLHRCPKFAIQYGRNTEKHGQYTNPNVKGVKIQFIGEKGAIFDRSLLMSFSTNLYDFAYGYPVFGSFPVAFYGINSCFSIGNIV